MEVFEVVIALLLGGAALAALARRIGAPYPALVALELATDRGARARRRCADDRRRHVRRTTARSRFALGRRDRTRREVVPARIRIPTYAVWEVAVFVLNVLAFILVGFQLKSIAARMTGAVGVQYTLFAVAVLVAAILARIAWVTATAALSRWWCRPRADGRPGPRDAVALTPRAAAIVGWCGMRGTVTLAAALALPTDFPYRDLILTTAFGVTLGTLVLQGLTLRPLMLRLQLEDDGTVDREIRLARVETLRSAVDAAADFESSESASLVQRRYALSLRRAEKAARARQAMMQPSCGQRLKRNDDGSLRCGRTARSAIRRFSVSRRSSTGRSLAGRKSSGRRSASRRTKKQILRFAQNDRGGLPPANILALAGS